MVVFCSPFERGGVAGVFRTLALVALFLPLDGAKLGLFPQALYFGLLLCRLAAGLQPLVVAAFALAGETLGNLVFDGGLLGAGLVEGGNLFPQFLCLKTFALGHLPTGCCGGEVFELFDETAAPVDIGLEGEAATVEVGEFEALDRLFELGGGGELAVGITGTQDGALAQELFVFVERPGVGVYRVAGSYGATR